MNLQALVDAISAGASKERANYHLTLGGLVDALEQAAPDMTVAYNDPAFGYPSSPESYRGYYSDLSFPPSSIPITVKELLSEAKDAIGASFEGYKGGDFQMHRDTPLWVSEYGRCSGYAIMGAEVIADRLVLITKHID